jgi:hypothetical protein
LISLLENGEIIPKCEKFISSFIFNEILILQKLHTLLNLPIWIAILKFEPRVYCSASLPSCRVLGTRPSGPHQRAQALTAKTGGSAGRRLYSPL